MANISTWSATAASNNSISPDGFPEGMAPSGVNNSAREVMAAVRAWYEDAQWINRADAGLAFATTTTFIVTGDLTAIYDVGRRVKATDATTLYGSITASSFSSPNTTVTVVLDSGVLSASLTAVSVSIISGASPAFQAYAVGDISISVSATNPAVKYGYGTWVQIAKGRTLIGEGTGAGLTARTAAAELGQEDAINVAHSHAITDPGHVHSISAGVLDGTGVVDQSSLFSAGINTASNTTGITVDSAGASGTDKNMQPSLVVYIWERTA